MKQLIYVILLLFLLTTACNSDKKINTSTTLQDNRQSEKFEADRKQGFALPGLDHGLIQSPINILTKTY
jgi:hypothetical protein